MAIGTDFCDREIVLTTNFVMQFSFFLKYDSIDFT